MHNVICKFFTATCILAPILIIYNSPILGGSLLDFALLITLFFILFDKLKTPKIHRSNLCIELIPIFLYIVINAIISLNITYGIDNELIKFTFRYSLYVFILIFFTKEYFDIGFGLKLFQFVCIFASIWAVFQLIFINYFHILLPNTIPGIPTSSMYESDIQYIDYPQYYRPCSIFLEPAHYCEYVVAYMAWIVLCKRKPIVKDYLSFIICSVGILLSGSSTGILSVMVILALFIFNHLKHSNKVEALIILSFFIAAIMIFQTNTFQIFVKRTILSNNALEGRILNAPDVFKLTSLKTFIWGSGLRFQTIANLFGYLPSIPLIFAYWGGIGLIVCAFTVVCIFIKTNRGNKQFLIVFIILCLGTEALFVSYFLLYMPFIVKGVLRNYESSKFSEYNSTDISKRGHT